MKSDLSKPIFFAIGLRSIKEEIEDVGFDKASYTTLRESTVW